MKGGLLEIFTRSLRLCSRQKEASKFRQTPPPVSEVWLCEMPFITMVASIVETYKKECCGLFLGYRSWSHWDKTRRAIIEQAYPFQTSKRSYSSVTVPREENRCKEMIYKLSMFEPLGYFHSHPNCDFSPTSDDIESMNVNDVEIIVSIRKGKKVSWRYDLDKEILSGTLGEFRFEMVAYTRLKKKKLPVKRIGLLCPFTIGIGSKFFDTQAKPME